MAFGDSSAGTHRLQDLVDSLAVRLDHPVLVDDAQLRPLAYSPQPLDGVDRVRAMSILSREAPPEAAAYLFAQGIRDADGATRVAADATIGLDGRVCSPIVTDDVLVGFLWVVEGDDTLDEQQLQLIAQIAEGAGPLLQRPSSRPREALLRTHIEALLSPDAGVSCDATADLLDSGAFASSGSVAVLVAGILPPPGAQVDETMTVLLSRGLHAFGRATAGERHLLLTRRDHAVVILGDERPERLSQRLAKLGATLREEIGAVVAHDGWTVAVGVGSTTPSLAGAPRSYGHALRAMHVAARIPQTDPVLAWDDMGIYRLFSSPGVGDIDREAFPPGLLTLLAHPGGEMLLHTLETYLDHGGDAQATTAELFLARGSLYYRLHRIEEIAGVSLRSGHDRLMLHLGLKLARLNGLYPTAVEDDAAAGGVPAVAAAG